MCLIRVNVQIFLSANGRRYEASLDSGGTQSYIGSTLHRYRLNSIEKYHKNRATREGQVSLEFFQITLLISAENLTDGSRGGGRIMRETFETDEYYD